MSHGDGEACDHCGTRDAPGHDEHVWVGGHGWEWRRKCDNDRACWNAWSKRQQAALTEMAAARAAAVEVRA